MSRRTAAWVAWSVCAASLLIMALGVLLIFLGWSTPRPPGWYPWAYMANDIVRPWCTTTRRSHSVAATREPLRMVVARHGG
jgi:hypothetical protein